MSKIGRNEPCACGSGKKYKKCCFLHPDAKPTSASPIRYIPVYTELDQLSNRVVDLINQNKLEKAEAVSRRLLAAYPDQVDGFDRLAMVCEARGEKKRPRSTIAKQPILRNQTPALMTIALPDFYSKQKSWNRTSKDKNAK